MILLDTNALVFLISSPKKLSQKASNRIDLEIKKKDIYVSSISIWEICLLVKAAKLELVMDVDTWIEKIEKLDFLKFVPVDNKIAAKSVALPEAVGRDPADRIIVATATGLGATLVTSDQKIRKYSGVKTIW